MSGFNSGKTGQYVLDALTVASSLSSEAGAGFVGCKQSGSGAQPRTLSDRLMDSLHVCDFMTASQIADARSGAKTIDLSAPLQAAINEAASSGRVLEFKGTACRVDTTLTLPGNVHLDGRKASLDFSNIANDIGLSNVAGGAVIEDFAEIRGPGNTVYAGTSNAIYASGAYNAGEAPDYIPGPKVRRCNIVGWGAYGVRLQFCLAPEVVDCSIGEVGYAAVGGSSCTDGKANRNTIENVGPGTSGNAYGVFWSRGEGLEVEYPRSRDCTMNDNTVDGVLWEALDTHGGVNISAHRNTIRNSKVAIAFVASDLADNVETFAPLNCKANDNVIYGDDDNPIVIAGATRGINDIAEYASGCEASNNTIVGGGIAGNNNSGMIRIVATDGAQIHNNTLRGGGPFGVCVMADNKNLSITGGTMKDMNDASVTICAGVAIRGVNCSGYIGGITFVREDTGLPNVMKHSVYVTSGLSPDIDIVVGRCAFIGDTASNLLFNPAGEVAGVASTAMMEAAGTGTIAQVSGQTANFIDIVFAKPLVRNPAVSITRTSATNTGGKAPDLRASNITRTSFRLLASPVDLGTWSASGSLTFTWRATT